MPRLTTQTTPEATDCGLRWVASRTYNLTRRIPECFPGFRTQMRLAWLIYKLVIKLNAPFTCTTKWNLVVHFTNQDHSEQIVFWEAFWIPYNLHFANLIVGQMSPRMYQFDACANAQLLNLLCLQESHSPLYNTTLLYHTNLAHKSRLWQQLQRNGFHKMHAITTPV